MYCEECKQKPATVHFTQIINGQKMESHLCEECAAQKGGILFKPGVTFSIPNLLGSIFGTTYEVQNMAAFPQSNTCHNCGMSFSGICQTGKLGCSECYQAFAQELEPTLRNIHGNTQHRGKIPSRGGAQVLIKKEIEALKNKLQQAILREEYEQAAEIRDSIKEMENKLG